MDTRRSWKVILLGGAGGTGKSLLAAQLGRHFGIPWLEADDMRLALQRVTTPAQLPDLHYFVETHDLWRVPSEQLRDRLIAVARMVSRGLEVVIDNHVAHAGPLIVEGDGILPSLARRPGVWAIFLHERDEAEIARNMSERGRGFGERSPKVRATQVRLNFIFGNWLREEAKNEGVPVIAARPRETIFARVLAEIERG